MKFGHVPPQAVIRTFKDAGVRLSFRKRVREDFVVMTARHEKSRARGDQQRFQGRIHSTWLWASIRKGCRACRVKKGTAGCRWYGGHRQDLNEREPRCGEHLEGLQWGLASSIFADGSRGHRSRVGIQEGILASHHVCFAA